MPRQRLPVQYFADIVDELKGVNARLDRLISQQAPATLEASEPAGDEPVRVRLEEPVRPDSEPAVVAEIDPDFPDSGRAENAPNGTCQEQTKRGNTCGRSLPCPYHG